MRKLKERVIDVPRLMKEWDFECNNAEGIFPDALGSQSNTYAYWKCEYGHKWKAKINNRYNGRGCPECRKGIGTSFTEQALYYYIKNYFPDAISGYTEIFTNGMELDIYIPSLNIGVEYDGMAWHNSSTLAKERKKLLICAEHSITLYRVKEESPDLFPELKITYSPIQYRHNPELYYLGTTDNLFYNRNPQDEKSLDLVIGDVLTALSVKFDNSDIDTKRDRNAILEQYKSELLNRSLAVQYPEVAKLWHPHKNGNLTPEMFPSHSNSKFWWLGECGHEWESQINVLTRGNRCPYCSGRTLLKGYNDLATRYPLIAAQWHPEKNGSKTPDMFTWGSGHVAYWLCPVCNQEWKTAINNRTCNNRGCPYCAHQKPIKGVNSLPAIRPDLMKDWNYEKNEGLDPEDFMPSSNKKVWWKCSECGYEYSTQISNRNRGTGCKRCAGQVLIYGENDLETKYPEMAVEWDYEKNDLLPSQVFANSNIKFYWKCKLGHEWEAAPNSRARGTGCPICAGNVVLKGFNDLTTTHPEIAAKWHPTKNGNLLPSEVSKGYKDKVWFQCPDCGKAYDSYIGNVVKGYGRCPYCTSRKSVGKYVYQVETGKYFNTLKEATESIGKTDIRLIQMCCKGRCKTAYGYHWEYRTKE